MHIIRLWSCLLLACVVPQAIASMNTYIETIKSDPKALYTFFKAMPKGGELHYHLAGGAYPEIMLTVAATDNYCIDNQTFAIRKTTTHCDGTLASELATKPALYKKIIKAWSMKQFIPGQESGHDHFFTSFNKFMPAASHFYSELLASVMQRAADQHELYLEVMLLPDNAQSSAFAEQLNNQSTFADKRNRLLSYPPFQNNIRYTINESKRILQQARHHLGCDTRPQQAVCSLTVKFQYHILREQPLDKVFAQALNGFAAAAQSSDIVGINLVQAEDGKISLRDYKAQMQILNFLHHVYPNVHIALHAGELSPNIAPNGALRFHIHDAILTGHAERIGHGVDITHEDKAADLLNHMANTPIPVEINLTSNDAILHINGVQHPLRLYLAHHVPVVLSTDDEGILRTNLTHQYVDAVHNHNLDYSVIKSINRNALTYSFLPGKSLWINPTTSRPVAACQTMQSKACRLFIQNNEKARLQWQLERQLTAFEMDDKIRFSSHTR